MKKLNPASGLVNIKAIEFAGAGIGKLPFAKRRVIF